MPEDEKLTMEEMLSQAAGNEPTPEEPTPEEPTPEEPTPEEPTPEEPTPEEPTPEEPTPEEPTPEEPKAKPNPIKEVRDRLAQEKAEKEKVTTTVNKFVAGTYKFSLKDHMLEDGSGVDIDSLSKAMDAADVANRAEDKGLTPEVQAELERIEKDKIEIQKQRLQLSMDQALTNLQMEIGLKQADVNNFFADAMKSNKNPYQWIAQGGTLGDLYNIVYSDRIQQDRIKAAIEEERKKWEAKGSAPLPNPGQPVPQTPRKKDGVSMRDLLKEAAENNAK